MVATPRHPTDDFKYWRYMQPGSQELRDIHAHYAAVIRGLVPGSIPFSAYGRVNAGVIASPYQIWPGPTAVQPVHLTGDTVTLQSSSPNDSFGGSGIQSIEVHYIDSNGLNQSWSTPMSGVTHIPLPETIRFIQCLHSTKGSIAAGDITITNAGDTVYSIIPTGTLRCASAMRYVPDDKRFFMVDITGGSGSGTAASVSEIDLISTELDEHGYLNEGLYVPHNGIVVQDNSLGLSMGSLFSVGPGQMVGGQFTTSKGAIITMSYAGWLEDL